ncbi:MAG: ABC transporter permease [Longimicrobiales bacterium]|nr:ABC transporter permease [Longimicrobiales bacterium]
MDGVSRSSLNAAFFGLLRKEVFHILRDRRTLFVVLAMPVVQVVLFGFALQTDVDHVRLAIVDPRPDPRTREVASRFRAPAEYDVVATLSSVDELPDLFQRGEADQALVFESDFDRKLWLPGGSRVLVVTDASSPLVGSSMEAYARGVLAGYGRELAEEGRAAAAVGTRGTDRAAPGAGPSGGPARIESRTHFRFNPTLESQLLFVPGLLAFVLTIVSALMTAITVSREKETGTMEILLVSPLSPPQIILGKVTPYLALAFLNALSTLAVAWLVFGVPFRGNVWLLFGESLLFVTVMLAFGVLISTRTPSQRTAMLTVMLGTLLPTAILSGMIFPIESMPGWLQPVSLIIPATWFISIVRGIMLKGAGLPALWQETLILFLMASVLLVMSIRALRPRLE